MAIVVNESAPRYIITEAAVNTFYSTPMNILFGVIYRHCYPIPDMDVIEDVVYTDDYITALESFDENALNDIIELFKYSLIMTYLPQNIKNAIHNHEATMSKIIIEFCSCDKYMVTMDFIEPQQDLHETISIAISDLILAVTDVVEEENLDCIASYSDPGINEETVIPYLFSSQFFMPA